MKQNKAKNWVSWLMRNYRLTFLMIGLAFLMGIFGIDKMAKAEFPDITIRQGVVIASVPLSAWWGGSHAIRRQKMKVQQAQNDQQEALEMLTIDIESAWSNLYEAQEQVRVAESAVRQSEENLRQSNAKYSAGTEDLTDLLDAETLHRQSQNNLSSSIAAYQVALVKYKLKVGNE